MRSSWYQYKGSGQWSLVNINIKAHLDKVWFFWYRKKALSDKST